MFGASVFAKRAAFSIGFASTIPFYMYISDSQSSFYKIALQVGQLVTSTDAEMAHKSTYFFKMSLFVFT